MTRLKQERLGGAAAIRKINAFPEFPNCFLKRLAMHCTHLSIIQGISRKTR